MPSLREQFVVGVTTSFRAATVEQVDAALQQCRTQLGRGDLTPRHRRNLRIDVDRLLDRRHELAASSSKPALTKRQGVTP